MGRGGGRGDGRGHGLHTQEYSSHKEHPERILAPISVASPAVMLARAKDRHLKEKVRKCLTVDNIPPCVLSGSMGPHDPHGENHPSRRAGPMNRYNLKQNFSRTLHPFTPLI